jgi:hypothetical protein
VSQVQILSSKFPASIEACRATLRQRRMVVNEVRDTADRNPYAPPRAPVTDLTGHMRGPRPADRRIPTLLLVLGVSLVGAAGWYVAVRLAILTMIDVLDPLIGHGPNMVVPETVAIASPGDSSNL